MPTSLLPVYTTAQEQARGQAPPFTLSIKQPYRMCRYIELIASNMAGSSVIARSVICT